MLLVFVIVSVGIRPFFAFEDDAGGFEGLEFVPDAFGNVNTVDAVFWLRTTLSITEPSSLYVVDLTLPRSITNDSSLSGCLWIGMSVPVSTALSIR